MLTSLSNDLKAMANGYQFPEYAEYSPMELQKRRKSKKKSEFEGWPKVHLAIIVAELEWNKTHLSWSWMSIVLQVIRIMSLTDFQNLTQIQMVK